MQELTFVKLLISEMRAWSAYISREFYYTMTELVATYGWKHVDTQELWNQPGSLADRLQRQFGEMPSVILLWERYDFFISVLAELRKLPIVTCIFADDLHWTDATMRSQKLASLSTCDLILAAYEPVFDTFYPGVRRTKNIVWTPHAACPDYFLTFNDNPLRSVLLSGKIHPAYPLRVKLRELHESGNYPIDLLAHPGYHCEYDYASDPAVGAGYAEEIHSRLCAFTCAAKHKYIVGKFFEIPATGSLLLADASVSRPLLELGYVEYQHYVPVHADRVQDALDFALDPANRGVADRIRRAGQELVMARHTTRHRAKLINEACTSA